MPDAAAYSMLSDFGVDPIHFDHRWRQVGRCVYCECGPRLYQWDHPRRSPRGAEPPTLSEERPCYRHAGEVGEGVNSAEMCAENGWGPGTRLVGDEGYGPTTIEITAVGEESVLAKTLTERGWTREGTWTLERREWREVVTLEPSP